MIIYGQPVIHIPIRVRSIVEESRRQGHERLSNDGAGDEQEVAVNDAPRKRVEYSNANGNKELTSPIIAQNAVYAANFAPFLHSFWKSLSI
jgi:hypothetical protein